MLTDNSLIQLFLPIINAGLIADGFTDVITKQANQPTQQGVNSGSTVYFYKIANKRYGFLKRLDEWDSINSIMTHTETQVFETTFQVNALVIQNPLKPTGYTASDLVNEVASILQSDYAITTLMASEVGILRIQDVLNPYFVDDKDNFEASPSFDFTLTYKQTRVTTDPVINSFDYVIDAI